jgi:Calcineurin-like phosphoesterase
LTGLTLLKQFQEGYSMARKSRTSERQVRKAAPAKRTPTPRGTKSAPLRFAHPFFTATPPAQRAVSPATHTQSLSQFAAQKLGPIPKPARDPAMQLQDIIGQPGTDEIQAAGAIRLHAMGDTGRPGGANTEQEQVAEAMTGDYDPAAGGHNPALLLHLGDVIYGHDKAQLYRDEFYRAYMKYPGKIIAIPGNHDGEVFAGTDPVSLKEFQNNFCAASAVVPKTAADVRIFRETMTQPGVYWMLSAPFVNVIGLYSNIAEGPGNLLGANQDDQQIKWLTKTLASLKQSGDHKALVIATHHPSYSSGGHSGSPEMLVQIDKACNDAGVVPHALLAGHSHTYQRYTRTTKIAGATVQIPYLVAGCGGHAASAVTAATGQHMGDTIFQKSLQGYGYLLLTASKTQVVIEMIETTNGVKKSFDKATVDIAGHRVS